jgi:formiminotetrahydrofolate cyclodeaminase
VRWRVLVVISPRSNEAATTDIEAATDVVLANIPATMNVEQVNAPQLQDTGAQGTVLTTEINVSAHWKE